MKNELYQEPKWYNAGKYFVSSELFLDLIFTDKCNCNCPFCIAKTKSYAKEDFEKWKTSLKKALDIFDIKDVIILGGEATVDTNFWQKVEYLASMGKEFRNIILSTNGIMLRNDEFLKRICNSIITSVNLSYMNYEKKKNDSIFSADTLTISQIKHIYETLKSHKKTLRINTNVYKDNLDSVNEMENFVNTFRGCCDYIKFSPLMSTEMFETDEKVTRYSKKVAFSESEIKRLFDDFSFGHTIKKRASNILGFVDYSELSVFGQDVILKYAQVEDKYDRDKYVPTLKLYPNGNLSNEWNYMKDLLTDFDV